MGEDLLAVPALHQDSPSHPFSTFYLFSEVPSAPYTLHWPDATTTYASFMKIIEVLGKPFQQLFAIETKATEFHLTAWYWLSYHAATSVCL
jgi:hypothetical protein